MQAMLRIALAVVGFVLIYSPAWALVPQLQLRSAEGLINLGAAAAVWSEPLDVPVDLDRWWQQGQSAALLPSGATTLRLEPQQRSMAAVTLRSEAKHASYLIEVPLTRLDQVQVFWRTPGQSWQMAQAGDRVAQKDWPFAGPFPAFPIYVADQPVQLLVTLVNNGAMQAPLWIMPDDLFREHRFLQSSVMGFVTGLHFMVVLVCGISAYTQKLRAGWILLAYSLVAWLAHISSNGYAAIWLTPNWPAFNDASKHFIAVLMAGLLVASTVATRDSRWVAPWQRRSPLLVIVTALLLGVLQIEVLPPAWRQTTAGGWMIFCVLSCLLLCAQVRLLGARPPVWGLLAVLGFLAGVLLTFLNLANPLYWHSVNLANTCAMALLAASSLLFRHDLLVQYRYGQHVLGRDLTQRARDPLTGCLSFDGFRHAFDEQVLLEQATNTPGWLALLEIRGAHAASTEYGVVTSEQLVVRIAAILQRGIGKDWQIGRVGDKHFAALTHTTYSSEQIREQFTAILAAALGYREPQDWVEKLDLRIAGTCQWFQKTGLKPVFAELNEAIEKLQGTKRFSVDVSAAASAAYNQSHVHPSASAYRIFRR
ncbi:MAG: 7TM-DISM domain-containing protein [Burkholderiales bacterium]